MMGRAGQGRARKCAMDVTRNHEFQDTATASRNIAIAFQDTATASQDTATASQEVILHLLHLDK